jgi:hypothetical protein
MIRSVSKDVTVVAGSETVETFVTGIAGKTRKILFLWFEAVASVSLRGYLDQDRIVDVQGDCEQIAFQSVQVNAELPEGKEFKAGHYNPTGGNITQAITVFFEED